jgi:hypothetical protein
MAFADPQSVTISGTATSLPRVSSEKNAGTFSTADQATRLTDSHTYGTRVRHLIRLDNTKTAADPLLAGVNVQQSMSAYLVVDVPLSGYSVVDQKAIVDALVAYLSASTGARTTQLLGGEN